jgi:hypothetical protein
MSAVEDTGIDWNKFSNVPVGTHIRDYLLPTGEYDTEGILLENYPYWKEEWGFQSNFICLRVVITRWVQEAHLDPRDLEYLIDGEWKTFEQVMA